MFSETNEVQRYVSRPNDEPDFPSPSPNKRQISIRHLSNVFVQSSTF